MEKVNLEEYIAMYKGVSELKNSISSLVIDWETDTAKIVIPTPYLAGKYQSLTIGSIKVEEKHFDESFLIDQAVVSLVDDIKNGEKIKPPTVVISLRYDGRTNTITEISKELVEGNKKLFVSNCSGFKEVPCLEIKRIESFIFPIAFWNIETVDTNLVASSTLFDKEFTFPISNITTDLELSKKGSSETIMAFKFDNSSEIN